jgi:hypothetical protein
VLLVIGFLVGRAWVESYLKSERFRLFVSRSVGETLKAQAEFAPFRVTGMQFYSDGLKARGSEAASFSDLRVDQVRAEVSTRRFLERVWQIEDLEAQRLEVRFDGPRTLLPPSQPQERTARTGTTWLPNRVEIGSARIREMNLHWGAGGAGRLTGTTVEVRPHDGGWNIEGVSGRLEQAGYPSLDLQTAQLHYRGTSLFIKASDLRQGEAGRLQATGELRMRESIELQVALQGIDVKNFLTGDWRLRVHGAMGGEVTVQSALPATEAPTLFGKLHMESGHLEALPVLEQIALFTRMQQFRRIALSKASAQFRQSSSEVTVTDFVAESDGLLRMEGAFTVIRGMISGDFQVGVTPAALQWLPGSQERVFTVARGGYLWTPLRLAGPVEKPQEDLSPRLIAAAKGAVLQGVENTVRDSINTGKDAVKGALDLLMPLLQPK